MYLSWHAARITMEGDDQSSPWKRMAAELQISELDINTSVSFCVIMKQNYFQIISGGISCEVR